MSKDIPKSLIQYFDNIPKIQSTSIADRVAERAIDKHRNRPVSVPVTEDPFKDFDNTIFDPKKSKVKFSRDKWILKDAPKPTATKTTTGRRGIVKRNVIKESE